MNYTSKHHLPQWSKSDRILMDDFNAAMANIEAALNAAAAAVSSVRPFATGTYTGKAADQVVNLGFRPSFVLINGNRSQLGATDYFGPFSCATGTAKSIPLCLEITSTGFIAKKTDATTPNLVSEGRLYEYIAFR